MNIVQEKELLDKGENLIFYRKDVKECYDVLKDQYRCVYLESPRPPKTRLMEAIKELVGDKYGSFSNRTIPDLQKILIEESHIQRLIILFNGFEDLTWKMSLSYRYLHENGDIVFIASFTKYYQTQGELADYYKTFHVVNEDELKKDVNYDTINITYPVYIFIALLLFVLYLKAASSLAVATILLGAVWFAFLAFRTLIFVGGKV